jgi:hypothetical protein
MDAHTWSLEFGVGNWSLECVDTFQCSDFQN